MWWSPCYNTLSTLFLPSCNAVLIKEYGPIFNFCVVFFSTKIRCDFDGIWDITNPEKAEVVSRIGGSEQMVKPLFLYFLILFIVSPSYLPSVVHRCLGFFSRNRPLTEFVCLPVWSLRPLSCSKYLYVTGCPCMHVRSVTSDSLRPHGL